MSKTITTAPPPASAAPASIETRTAIVHLRDDGIVQVRIRAKLVQMPDDAEANIAASIQVAVGVRRPIMVDISDAEPLSPEGRRIYSGRVLTDSFTALALVVQATPFGRMLGNVYFRIARPGIPIGLFDAQPPALAWLKAKAT